MGDVAREVEGMKAQVDGAKKEGERHAGGAAGATAGLPDPDAFRSGSGDEEDGEGDEYEEFEQLRQQEILEEQDEALDGVFRTVGTLREQADAMGRELEEQGEMLDEVDDIADRVGGKLQQGLKKVQWVIKNNEGMLRAVEKGVGLVSRYWKRMAGCCLVLLCCLVH